MSKTGQDVKIDFFFNVSLIMLKKSYTVPKKGLGQKISEKQQNDGYMTPYVKFGTCYGNENFFKMFLWSN